MRTIGTTSVDGEVRAVASGALPNGKPVVVNADGTASVVAETSATQSAGSAQVFESATTAYISSAFDSNSNRLVISYQDQGNSSYGTVVVATVGETSLTFGTPVVFNSGGTRTYPSSAVFDSNLNKIVIFFQDEGDGDKGKAIVGTVDPSDNSISFGSEVAFDTSGASSEIAATFDSNANKIVIFYRDGGDTNKGISFVATVSGTSISFGSATEVTENNSNYNAISFDSTANKVVAVWMDGSASNRGKARVGTVSGTSISFGDNTDGVQFSATNNSDHTSVAYDPDQNKTVIAYSIGTATGTAIVGTISGTSISFGTAVNYNSGRTDDCVAVYDTLANKVVIAYKDQGNSGKGTAITGTVSGTSISFDSELAFEAGLTSYLTSTFVPTVNRTVFAFQDEGNSNYGTSVVFTAAFTATTLTSENFIGFPKAAASDGGTATVQIGSNISSVNIDLIVTGFDLANAVYDNVSFSINPQEGSPSGLFFKPDGTKMFVCGTAGDDVNEYSLSTAWDLSTASYSRNFSVSSQDSYPYGVFFKPEGDIMYISGTGNDKVYQYALSTAWNVSSASYTKAFSVGGQETEPVGLFFKTDGTKMYICGDQGNDVNEYNLSTAWDIATASFSQSFSVASQHSFPQALSFNAEGTLLFVTGSDNDDISQYSLTTGWDVSTASYDDVSFSHSGQETTATGFFFRPDGTKFYLVGTVNDTVFQYSSGSVVNPAMTAGQQYFVQTNGRLGLTADDPSVIAGTAISSSKLIVKG